MSFQHLEIIQINFLEQWFKHHQQNYLILIGSYDKRRLLYCPIPPEVLLNVI